MFPARAAAFTLCPGWMPGPQRLSGNGSDPAAQRERFNHSQLDERLRQEQLAAQMLEQTEEAETQEMPEEVVEEPPSAHAHARSPPSHAAILHRDLVAYRWTGSTPQAQRVGDISDTGIVSADR